MYKSKDNSKLNPCIPVTQFLQLTRDSEHFMYFLLLSHILVPLKL